MFEVLILAIYGLVTSGIQEGLGSSMFIWDSSFCGATEELSTQTNHIFWPLQIQHRSSG